MAKRLTPDEKEAIVELRLNRVPVRRVAEQVACTTQTVVRVWKQWLSESAAERAAALEETREELIQRHQRAAKDAREGVLRSQRASDCAAEVRYLAAEAASLKEIARLTGSDAPAKIEHSGETGFTVLRIIEETVEGAE